MVTDSTRNENKPQGSNTSSSALHTLSSTRFPVIAGPCQIENLEHSLLIARHLAALQEKLPIKVFFKSSFDKANRTSYGSERGVGIEKGIEILSAVRSETKLPVITDIHHPEHAPLCATVCDIIQVPAFLCRQTDLLIAAGETGKFVNIKKGQFLSPSDMKHAAEKVALTGNNKILLCERGTCFGYRDLVVDMRGILIMQAHEWPVFYDATHSVQSMGGAGATSGGSREFVVPLLRSAVSIGCDGIFLECHENPSQAPSDGPVMLPLNSIERVLTEICQLRSLVENFAEVRNKRSPRTENTINQLLDITPE